MKRPGIPTLVVGNLMVLLLLLASVGLALELYYRYVYDATDTANQSRLSKRWFARYWHLNSDGIRDDVDYERALAPGRRRITFLGDSYTAGHGLKHVSDRFVNRIRAEMSDWDVHSIAYNGINTVSELEELRRFLEDDYELDVVVLVYTYNDIDTYIPEFQEFYRYVEIPPDFLAPLLDTSYAADLYWRRWRQRQHALESDVPYPVLRSEAYDGEGWESLVFVLDALIREVSARSGYLATVTFPWMQMLDAGETELPMYSQLDAFWRARGVPHLQLLPFLEPHVGEGLIVNRRDTHPNARAHQLAADSILRFLEEKVLPLGAGDA